jgi:hypothetical protein
MSERKQRFFVMDNPQIGMRYVFEIYETIDRVVVLVTHKGVNPAAHNYQTYKTDDARRLWRDLFLNPPHIYTRNTEIEKELNASR